jgi:LacI family transcriptional regulator
MESKITISTLAKELGVSIATVSRALNNSPKVSNERRQQILQLAAKKNFKLRAFAPRVTNLCVLICTDSSPGENIFSTYTDQVINGMNQYCTEHDLELSIFSATNQRLNTIDFVKELFRRNIDGVVILDADDRSLFIKSLNDAKIPWCALISGHPDLPERTLTISNYELAETATQYLIQIGHRNIAFLTDHTPSISYQQRLDGYTAAIQQAGLAPIISENMTRRKFDSAMDIGFALTENLLNSAAAPTAFFAVSTELAGGAHSALHGKGLTVPDDVSLIGCDDCPAAEHWRPPLTVIDIPNKQMGRTAAAWVHEQMDDFNAARPDYESWMKGHLIIRKTTAPPRKKS